MDFLLNIELHKACRRDAAAARMNGAAMRFGKTARRLAGGTEAGAA